MTDGSRPSDPLRLLTFTTLYPNAAQPNHGVFVENRLRHLVGSGEVESTVLAPVPYFPSASPRFGDWAKFAAAPRREERHGIAVHHPRYPVIPRIGMSVAPALLYAASVRAARRLQREGGGFDAIDAHYLYPDGIAAIALGRRLRLPVVITARGSDVTQYPDYAIPRLAIRRALARADALIAVSDGLRQALLRLGAAPEKLRVLRNGVDAALFRPPADREAARRALGFSAPTLLSVGALIPRKAHHRTIEALRLLPGWHLVVAGEGPERARLEALAAQWGVSGRVRLLGARPHAELPALYGAADLSVLASEREGWANVLLESMACGTPVVATDIPGNPEVVSRREAGLIVRENTPAGIAAAVHSLWSDPPARAATRAYAERMSWDETTAGQLDVFRRVTGAAPAQVKRAA